MRGWRSLFLGLGHKQGEDHHHHEPEQDGYYGVLPPQLSREPCGACRREEGEEEHPEGRDRRGIL